MFIVIEGCDGAGKTTLAHAIAQDLAKHSQDVVLTREPGGTPLGEELRGCLKGYAKPEQGASPQSPDAKSLHVAAEALLFYGLRLQHWHQRIAPALARQGVVVCDRFFLSSWVYQGVLRGYGVENMQALHNLVMPADATPTVTLVLDLPWDIACTRLAGRGDANVNDYDSRGRAAYDQVRDAYTEVARSYPNTVTLDASLGTADLLSQALQAVRDFGLTSAQGGSYF